MASSEQTSLRIGVDVGGTFTDLVASDGRQFHVVKIPSTPPDFHLAVIEAVRLAAAFGTPVQIIHGSTVATNALLQRTGAPVAFVTTDGFRDMLLIGRQNRPSLYALHIVRPQPLTGDENWFTVRERIGASGEVVEALTEDEVDRLIAQIQSRGLHHVAVCLLFSFINPDHEQLIARKCRAAGLSVSLSSEILPEFREYERASTTVINAAMRPVVREYLENLEAGLGGTRGRDGEGARGREVGSASRTISGGHSPSLQILHSSGGTLSINEASTYAARLVLSGPAGGVMGAAFVAKSSGHSNLITYDMGGTSTDVAVILDGQPQWTTQTNIDGLPIGLPMFDIHTVGAGGGSIAYIDAGGALRVGPKSAGAQPGPACYDRGGIEPTVTDANLLLGRLVPENFLGGKMRIDRNLAERAIAKLASTMNKSLIDTALGIVKVAEANMEHAIRAITSRRGHDPRQFTLVSFGGAGGLHVCALAEALDIPRVLIPPYCGVLSALGMVVAPPVADASRTVVHLGEALDDQRLIAELGSLNGITSDAIDYEHTDRVEAYADLRFKGQSYELKVKLDRASLEHGKGRFLEAYRALYGSVPAGREVEVVTVRIRRYGKTPEVRLPELETVATTSRAATEHEVIGSDGQAVRARVVQRAELGVGERLEGPYLLIDPEATTFVPVGWVGVRNQQGAVVLERSQRGTGVSPVRSLYSANLAGTPAKSA